MAKKDKITVDGVEYAAACVKVATAAIAHAEATTKYLEMCERTPTEKQLGGLEDMRNKKPWLWELIIENLKVWKRATMATAKALRHAEAELSALAAPTPPTGGNE